MIKKIILAGLLSVLSFSVFAADKGEVFKLSYIEREPGTDEYEVTMLVSERYIRVDELGEDNGFIIYDDKTKTIFSVSHHDKSILVIKENVFSDDDLPVKPVVEYLQLADAPMVSGKSMFNYRVFVNAEKEGVEETCIEVQLVEGLLPEVRKILQNYQKVVSGQQAKMTNNEITEMQTACFFVDQIYNLGEYYEKGLPVQEWRSNERSKILTDYKKISVDLNKFKLPEDYRQFSIGADSKTFIK
ncbi:MAG: hypothetical protein COA54_04910 [Thiotrichaceae bacterium]|nr:MAG: hypothetical protein COA54_04910 [Thiotrichaceae bacterium]